MAERSMTVLKRRLAGDLITPLQFVEGAAKSYRKYLEDSEDNYEVPPELEPEEDVDAPAAFSGDEEEVTLGRFSCLQCKARPSTTLLVPCRHVVLCQDCAVKKKEETGLCPSCAKEISSFFPVIIG